MRADVSHWDTSEQLSGTQIVATEVNKCTTSSVTHSEKKNLNVSPNDTLYCHRHISQCWDYWTCCEYFMNYFWALGDLSGLTYMWWCRDVRYTYILPCVITNVIKYILCFKIISVYLSHSLVCVCVCELWIDYWIILDCVRLRIHFDDCLKRVRVLQCLA